MYKIKIKMKATIIKTTLKSSSVLLSTSCKWISNSLVALKTLKKTILSIMHFKKLLNVPDNFMTIYSHSILKCSITIYQEHWIYYFLSWMQMRGNTYMLFIAINITAYGSYS